MVYHPFFRDFAGAELVTAWILQALSKDYDVVLWSQQTPDWSQLDQRFATSLAPKPPRFIPSSRSYRFLKKCFGDKGQIFLHSWYQRQMVAFDRKHHPAVWIGCYNETWLPSSGILYMHHPECITLPKVPSDWPRWRQVYFQKLMQFYLSLGLAKSQPPSAHHKLTNSQWTQQTYAAVGGGDSDVVYPPVPPFSPGLRWSQRENRVVMLGRWAVPKRLTLAMEIVAGARRAGAQITLSFVGFWHCSDQERLEIQAAARNYDWIEWHEHYSRAAVIELAGRSRYGLHAMEHEHFCIAVAELCTAGCIVLVPNSGGPSEIVEDPRQIYCDPADATKKLSDIAATPDLQQELHAKARAHGLRFSPEIFTARIQAVVNQVASSKRSAK